MIKLPSLNEIPASKEELDSLEKPKQNEKIFI